MESDGIGKSFAKATVMAMKKPAHPGFWWAKWKIADEGTREGGELTPSDEWEVMHVFSNTLDNTHPEHLMVFVPGVEKPQSLENFFWGPGPLEEPKS